jgi:hypothetical protein
MSDEAKEPRQDEHNRGWRMHWQDGQMVCAVAVDGERRRFEVRGGIAWPHVVSVGENSIAAGALVVAGYDPQRDCVVTLGHATFGAVVPVMNEQGWPLDLGAAGALAGAVASWGCYRWYSLDSFERQIDAVKAVRRRMATEVGAALIFAPLDVDAKEATGIVWRWTDAGRDRISQEVHTALKGEGYEASGAGPRPTLKAFAAVLASWDVRPWRAAPEAPWVQLRPEDVGR